MEELPWLIWVGPVYSHKSMKVGDPFPGKLETGNLRKTPCSGFEFEHEAAS